jgi:hypothetical protein
MQAYKLVTNLQTQSTRLAIYQFSSPLDIVKDKSNLDIDVSKLINVGTIAVKEGKTVYPAAIYQQNAISPISQSFSTEPNVRNPIKTFYITFRTNAGTVVIVVSVTDKVTLDLLSKSLLLKSISYSDKSLLENRLSIY